MSSSSGGEAPPFALSLRGELRHPGAEFRAAETCGDETAFWLYSSGSTGMPKGVRHVHSSLMETARLTGQGCLGIREDDLVFSAAKLFFAYGLGNAMSFPMSVGATTVLLPERPTPEAVLRTLKKHQPTLFFGVPTLYAAMLASPQGTPENSSSACAYASRPARRCRPRSGRHGRPGSASISSMASGPPRCCTSMSATALASEIRHVGQAGSRL